MKIFVALALSVVLLSGCAAQETFETVGDVYAVPASGAVYELVISLPEGTTQPVMESGSGGKLYDCDGFTVSTYTLSGGDLNRTLLALTGFGQDDLMLIKTKQGEFKRYDCAWTTAGEGTQQVCRTVLLDDGNTHHAVTVMADHERAGDLSAQWQQILDSVSLISTD